MLVEALLDKLLGVRCVGDMRWRARCPAHETHSESLSVALIGNKILLKCFAGCSYWQILHAVGVDGAGKFEVGNSASRWKAKPAQVFEAAYYAPLSLKIKWESVREWHYDNADGSRAFTVYRLNLPGGKKEVRPVTPCDGGYRWGLPPAPRPIYNLVEVLSSDGVVVVCEGEKATDAVRSAGWVATTSCGGAGSANKSDWSTLSGRHAIVWPDNDEPGIRYAHDVAETLRGFGCRVKILEPFGAVGDDAADCGNIESVLMNRGGVQ